jgi:TraB/PrgY/gumN family
VAWRNNDDTQDHIQPYSARINHNNPTHMNIQRSILFALFTSSALLACNTNAQTTASPAQSPTASGASPQTESAADTILVVGEQPGPGMWQVTKGNNTLWIIGTHTPVPQKMKWRAKGIREVVASAQEVLTPPGVTVSTKQIGIFRAITMIPAAMESRKNPDNATLKDLVPADIYQRWLVLRDKYIEEYNTTDESKDIERWRPIFAALTLYDAAIKKNGMTQTSPVWATVAAEAKLRKVKVTEVVLEPPIKDPRGALKEFSKTRLEDIDCFTKTIERLETDLRNMRARGNAWATGDVELLRRTPGADQRAACSSAIQNATFVKTLGVADIAKQVEAAWLAAAEKALEKNSVTVAVLTITSLTSANNYIDKLKARGYSVVEPE